MYQRLVFGSRSEKHVILPLLLPKNSLFNEAEVAVAEDAGSGNGSRKENDAPRKKGPKERSPESGGRRELPADLPRERVVHDLAEAEKTCPADGERMEVISEDKVEVLELVPPSFKVVEHVYPKYACPVCTDSAPQQAPAIPRVLPKSQCGPGLLAHILMSKFLLGLPFYRQEAEFESMGFSLQRTTMARWAISASQFLSPLLALMKDDLLSREVLHADETTLQVLNVPGKKPTSTSFVWTLCSAAPDAPAVWFEFHPNRDSASALQLLGDFRGILHVDGFAGYNAFCALPGVTRVGCWAHARREFDSAKKDGAKAGQGIAALFLDEIQKLFLLERDWENLVPEERNLERKQHSSAVVGKIRELLDEYLSKVTPKSKLGAALNYLQNQWLTLTAFLDDGRCALSNNRMENFIRPFVVGRRNWLFAETVAGAEASAGIYSLIVSAKANGHEVRSYLTTLFTELPPLLASNPDADLTSYLPWLWKSPQKN